MALEDKLFYRSIELDRAKVNQDERSIDVSFSSEEPVERYWMGKEILLHGDGNVDLSRLKKMGSALLNHNPDVIVGPLKNVRLEEKKGRASIVFDEDEDGNKAMNKVNSGSLKGVSVGYMVNKFMEVMEKEEFEGIKGPAMVATRWTPYEISLTPIPADSTVGVGRDLTRSLEGIEIEHSNNFKEETKMDREEIQAMINEAFAKVPKAEDIVSQIRAALAEDVKPKMTISVEKLQELMGRGKAISAEAELTVSRMAIVEAKNEQEIVNYLLDVATKKPDATDTGDIDPLKKKKEGGEFARVTSFDQIDDDTFFRSLTDSDELPLLQ